MQNKPTVTIGIPAHNEENNIQSLLRTIKKQDTSLFTLEKIIVVCDGCTDNTEEIVKSEKKNLKQLEVINDGKRFGKAERLNQIYENNQSDLIITIDGDVVLCNESVINNMVKTFLSSEEALVVAAHMTPANEKSFFGKISRYYFLLWDDIVCRWKDGKNIFTLHGSATLLKGTFAKKITYHKGTISDQNHLFVMTMKENPNGYLFAKNAPVLFRVVHTLQDCRLQGGRAIFSDKQNLQSTFGQNVRKYYFVPSSLKREIILCHFLSNPLMTILALTLSVIIRVFPILEKPNKQGIWETATSTKESININFI